MPEIVRASLRRQASAGWVGPEAVRISSEWVRDVARHNEPRLERLARRNGMSARQYKRVLTAHLDHLLQHADLRIRLDQESLGAVLTTGRIKTQFETGSSSALFAPPFRERGEKRIFGYEIDLAPEARPVYGYLLDGDESTGSSHGLEDYGDIVVIVSSDVRNRTSFTMGDSLDQTIAGEVPLIAPSPIKRPHWTSADLLTSDPLDLQQFQDYRFYVEAQIHGGLRAADIRTVRFPTKHWPDQETERLMDELGNLGGGIMMTIVATNEAVEGPYVGDPPSRYLLFVGRDGQRDQGRVLDVRRGILYPPRFIHSLLARGGWQEFTGDQAVLEELLNQVTSFGSWDEVRKAQARHGTVS